MSKRDTGTTKRYGFTLVEVCAVVAVIAAMIMYGASMTHCPGPDSYPATPHAPPADPCMAMDARTATPAPATSKTP